MFFRRLFGLAPRPPTGASPMVAALTTGDFRAVAEGQVEGRLLVRGNEDPRTARGPIVAEIGGLRFHEDPRLVTVCRATWRDVEFAGGKLPRCSLQRCSLQNVYFSDCDLSEWRLFSCSARDCVFRDVTLRGTAFSVLAENERTVLAGCRFIRCDLRETAYKEAYFENCVFEDCRIENVHFSTTSFTDVRFTGELRETIFRGRCANHTQINPMRRVDFSTARLSWVEFHEADLTQVNFPSDGEQVMIENWGRFLDALGEATNGREDVESRSLNAILGAWRKARGPRQELGFVNLGDVANDLGPIALEIVRAAIVTSRS